MHLLLLCSLLLPGTSKAQPTEATVLSGQIVGREFTYSMQPGDFLSILDALEAGERVEAREVIRKRGGIATRIGPPPEPAGTRRQRPDFVSRRRAFPQPALGGSRLGTVFLGVWVWVSWRRRA